MADRDEKITLRYDFGGTEEGKALAQTLTEIANGSSEAAPAARALVDQINALGDTSSAIEKVVELKSELGETKDKLAQAQDGLAALRKEFDETDASSGKVNAQFAKAEAQVAALTKQHNALQAQLATASGALEKSGVDTEHLDSAHRDLQASMARVATQASALTQAHNQAGEAAKKTGDAHEEAGKKAEKAGTAFEFVKEHLAELISIAAAAEAALKGIEFGKESIQDAAAVEAQLSRVRATAQATKEQFDEMGEAVEKAAKAVNEDSQVAAGGLSALVSHGLAAKDAVDALVPTLQLAKIANIDVGTAAEYVAKSLQSFNEPASESQRVVDLLTAASHGAAGGLGAISSAAVQLAPDARALGLDFNGLTGLLGLLASRGVDSEKSLRGLRTLFQDLQNPTSELRGELLALGDGTNRVDAAIAALTSGTPRANQALLTLSGGTRSIVEVLGREGPAAIARFTAELEAQAGIAERMTQLLDQNLGGAYKRLTLAVGDLGSELAKPVLEPLRVELEKLAKDLNDFAQSKDFDEIKGSIAGIVKDGVQQLDKALHDIDWKSFLTNAKEALKGVGDDLKGIADTASTIGTVVGKAGDVLSGAYHALGTTVDAVVAGAAKGADQMATLAERAALVAGGTLKVQAGLQGVHDVLRDVGNEADEQARGHFKKLGDSLEDLVAGSAKDAAATKAAGDAHAAAAPKIDQHAEAAKKAAAATNDVATVLPTMTARLGQGEHAVDDFGISLDRAADSQIEFQRKADGTIDKVASLQNAFAGLRVKSQADLEAAEQKAAAYFATVDKLSENTAAGLADRQNAFLAYAKTALAATAQLDDSARESAARQLEQQASVLGVTQALKDLEEQSASSQAALTSDADRSRAALDKEYESADRLAGRFHGGDGSIAEGAEKAAAATDDLAARGSSSLSQLASYAANTRDEFQQVSDAAVKAFDKRLLQDFNTEFDSTGIGFERTIRAIRDAGEQTRAEVAANRADVQGMIDDINSIGTASNRNFGGFGRDAASAAQHMGDLVDAIDNGSYSVGILGQQDLGPLRQALEDARQRAIALDQQFQETVDNIHEELLQAQGDINALEEERHSKRLANLKSEAELAGQLESDRYRQAVADEDAIHDINVANNAQQQEQQRSQKSSGGSGNGPRSPTSGGGSGFASGGGSSDFDSPLPGETAPPRSSTNSAPVISVPGGIPAQINYSGRTINLVFSSLNHANAFEDLLAEIARQKENST